MSFPMAAASRPKSNEWVAKTTSRKQPTRLHLKSIWVGPFRRPSSLAYYHHRRPDDDVGVRHAAKSQRPNGTPNARVPM